MTEPYIRTEFELEAVFQHRSGGTTTFKDVVSISATFAMNTIPTASLEVAAGVNVRDSQKATIHTVLEKLEPRDRCVVYLTIKSTEGRRTEPILNGMKDGKFIVFDGYYAGIGYQRSQNYCTYTINLIHWLDDLNCSSMLNGNWTPGTPNDLAQAASAIALSALVGGSGSDIAAAAQGADNIANGAPFIDHEYPEKGGESLVVTVDNMEDDLWEKVFKKIFKGFCDFKHPLTQCSDFFGDADSSSPEAGEIPDAEPSWTPGGNNKAARAALDRMPGKAPAKYKAKLPLNLTGYEDDEPFAHLSLSAAKGIESMIKQGIGYNTFWSKLVGELAPSFMFAVSPAVEFAQVIPFFPGLHTPHVTITGEEYSNANFTTNCAHMISSVVLKWPFHNSGAGITPGPLSPILGFCQPPGLYPVNSSDYKHHWGNILVREPPPWLANPIYAEASARENHLNMQGRSIYNPQEGSEENPEAKLKPQEIEKNLRELKDDVDGQNLSLYSRFACHWYKSAMLGQRFGELSGKLRFDIAPGSIVEVLPPETAVGEEKISMYGAVVQVSFVVNAEQHVAGTSFSLSHVRTKHENDIQNYNSKTHYVGSVAPLYKKAPPGSPWPGGPLVAEQIPGGLSAADAANNIPDTGGVELGNVA